MQDFGIDWEELVSARTSDDCDVVVPQTDNPLTQEQYTALCKSCDPLSMPDNFDGVDVYCAVRQFVCDILSQ